MQFHVWVVNPPEHTGARTVAFKRRGLAFAYARLLSGETPQPVMGLRGQMRMAYHTHGFPCVWVLRVKRVQLALEGIPLCAVKD